jgi:hypothetical protein
MKDNKTRPHADELETTKRPDAEDKTRTRSGAGKQRSGHHPGDREDPLPSHIDPQKPAGAAQYDPAQQPRRLDMPLGGQASQGEPRRGTAPSHSADRSHQPHKHDES